MNRLILHVWVLRYDCANGVFGVLPHACSQGHRVGRMITFFNSNNTKTPKGVCNYFSIVLVNKKVNHCPRIAIGQFVEVVHETVDLCASKQQRQLQCLVCVRGLL